MKTRTTNRPRYCLNLAAAAALMALLSLLSGCSLLGYALGSAIDNDDPDKISRDRLSADRLDRWDVREIAAGTTARLSLRGGSAIEGELVELTTLPEDAYRLAYDKARAELGASVPLPGPEDIVLVEEMDGKRHPVRFRGVALERVPSAPETWLALDVRIRDLQGLYLVLRNAGSGSPVAMRLSNLRGIYREDGSPLLGGRELRSLVLDGSVPLTTAAVLRVDDRLETIGLDRIDAVELTGSTTGATAVCTVAGAIVDATVIGIATVAIIRGTAVAMVGVMGQIHDDFHR